MVNAEVVRRRIERLNEYLHILQHYQDYDLETFLADPERYGSAERFLQLAIEATLDIASHLIADQQLGRVEKSRDLPRLLREHGLINDALEQRWIRMIGFRNILVHEYTEVDRRIVFRVLCEQLKDFRALRAVFAKFL